MNSMNRREFLGALSALFSQSGQPTTPLAPALQRFSPDEKNVINYIHTLVYTSSDSALQRLLANQTLTPDDFDDNNTPAYAADYVFTKASEYLRLRRRLALHEKETVKHVISSFPGTYSAPYYRALLNGFPIHDKARKNVPGRELDNRDLIDYLTETESPVQLLEQILSSTQHKGGFGCLGNVDDLELQQLVSKHFPDVWAEMSQGKHEDLQRQLKLDRTKTTTKNHYDHVWAQLAEHGNDYY